MDDENSTTDQPKTPKRRIWIILGWIILGVSVAGVGFLAYCWRVAPPKWFQPLGTWVNSHLIVFVIGVPVLNLFFNALLSMRKEPTRLYMLMSAAISSLLLLLALLISQYANDQKAAQVSIQTNQTNSTFLSEIHGLKLQLDMQAGKASRPQMDAHINERLYGLSSEDVAWAQNIVKSLPERQSDLVELRQKQNQLQETAEADAREQRKRANDVCYQVLKTTERTLENHLKLLAAAMGRSVKIESVDYPETFYPKTPFTTNGYVRIGDGTNAMQWEITLRVDEVPPSNPPRLIIMGPSNGRMPPSRLVVSANGFERGFAMLFISNMGTQLGDAISRGYPFSEHETYIREAVQKTVAEEIAAMAVK